MSELSIYAAVHIQTVSGALPFGKVQPPEASEGTASIGGRVQAVARGRTMRAMRPGPASSKERLPP